MKNAKDFSVTFEVDRTPNEVFAAINNVRAWWSGEIAGASDRVGAEFTYRHGDVHRSRQRVTEWAPGKRVAWHVLDSYLSFVEDKSEWNGTDVVFDIGAKNGKTEVRFMHKGLVPKNECYDTCSNAWGMLVNGNLRRLILTGKPQPDPFA